MQDYVNEGHLVPASAAPANPSDCYYIPYHIIDKKKFRVVFDASCASSSGISLNHRQLPGEKLQDDLGELFLRFRLNRFAITADVVKMFRQVCVNNEQWNYQRIFWRSTPCAPIEEFFITVVVWGMTSATFNAVRCLRQCAIDYKDEFPRASNATLNDFYVDDLLSGADSTEELVILFEQLTEMLGKTGFKLSKWVTNATNMPAEFTASRQPVQITPDSGILGMSWNPVDDQIKLRLTHEPNSLPENATKADIVSAISKVYDPSGLYGPVVVVGKQIMQDFWRFPKIKWTTVASPEFVKRATEFDNQVRLLTAINIPRWLCTSTNSSTECHIFTDASEIAYGAVAYIKTTGIHGDSSTMLLTSKSRVAPLKTQTIPRLELFGAVLGANLAAYIRKAFQNELLNIFCWTDSAIVLKWINTEPALLNSFIATRIVQLTDCVEASAWRHVKGIENPADILSRGASAAELANSTLWWNGPHWLKNNSATWTISTEPELSEAEIATLDKETKEKGQQKNRPVALVTTLSANSEGLSVSEKDGEQQSLLLRRSTLNSLLRVTAHVLRFIANIRDSIRRRLSQQSASADNDTPVNVSVSDRDQALYYWIGVAQQSAFSKEIKTCH